MKGDRAVADQASDAGQALRADHAHLDAHVASSGIRHQRQHALLDEIHVLYRLAGAEQGLTTDQPHWGKVWSQGVEIALRQRREQPVSKRWCPGRCWCTCHSGPCCADRHCGISIIAVSRLEHPGPLYTGLGFGRTMVRFPSVAAVENWWSKSNAWCLGPAIRPGWQRPLVAGASAV